MNKNTFTENDYKIWKTMHGVMKIIFMSLGFIIVSCFTVYVIEDKIISFTSSHFHVMLYTSLFTLIYAFFYCAIITLMDEYEYSNLNMENWEKVMDSDLSTILDDCTYLSPEKRLEAVSNWWKVREKDILKAVYLHKKRMGLI